MLEHVYLCYFLPVLMRCSRSKIVSINVYEIVHDQYERVEATKAALVLRTLEHSSKGYSPDVDVSSVRHDQAPRLARLHGIVAHSFWVDTSLFTAASKLALLKVKSATLHVRSISKGGVVSSSIKT